MIKKEAIKQAKRIPQEERKTAAIENLEKATKLLVDGEQGMEEQMKGVDKAFSFAIEMASPKDKQKVQSIVQQARQLTKEIGKGKDVHEIVKKINNLQNGC